MENIIFIYTLTDPRDERVRYVGKTANPGRRLRSHLSSAKCKGKTVKDAWVRELLALGLEPVLSVVSVSSEANWRDDEIRTIAQYADVTNQCLHGDGTTPRTEEWLQRLSASGLGKKRSPEIRAAKREQCLKRVENGCKRGHPWTEENTGYEMNGKHRRCRKCNAARARERRIRLGLNKGRQQTYCRKGHPLSGENLRIMERASGQIERICRICSTERNRQYKLRKRAQ